MRRHFAAAMLAAFAAALLVGAVSQGAPPKKVGAPASESAGDRVKRHATAKKRLARYLADKSKIKAEPLEKVLLAGITDPKERKKRIEAHAAAVAAKKAVRDKSLKALEANPKLRDRLEQRRREAKEIQMQKAKARSKGQ